MPKLEKCDRCLFYAHNPYLICAVHPGGVDSDCIDFRDNGKEEDQPKTLETDPFLIAEDCIDFRAYGLAEEFWSPEGYVWYGDNLQTINRSPLTTEQRLEILNTHPIFTGKCPSCGHGFENYPLIHWDCPNCGWVDESV